MAEVGEFRDPIPCYVPQTCPTTLDATGPRGEQPVETVCRAGFLATTARLVRTCDLLRATCST
jgi:hypothetical protein